MTLRLVPVLALSFTVVAARTVSAQAPAPRVDVSAQFTMLRLGDLDATSSGVGGRVVVGLSRWLSIDSELNFYPKDDFALPLFAASAGTVMASADPSLIYRRQRIDGLAGLRVGWRGARAGVFAKARPGFSRLIDQGVECGGDVCALVLLARPEYRTEFAFDAGGIFEVYPTAGTLLRVDVGDVMIRHRGFAPPCSDCTTHNLTTRVGAGIRF